MSNGEIIKIFEERLRQAQIKSDIDELDILIDDSLVFTALDGSIVGKEDDINLHKSSNFSITKMNILEQEIMDFEAVVVTSTLMDACVNVGGVEQVGRLRYTRVWKNYSNNWRIVAGHMSAVQESAP